MPDPFIGEIRMFAGNFPPQGWAICDGSLLSIAQNSPLFALLGTMYGGNGQNNFALPDLRGRIPVASGQGPGLSPYNVGQLGGTENVTLTTQQMPAHIHSATAAVNASATGDSDNPSGAAPAGGSSQNIYSSRGPDGSTAMAGNMVGVTIGPTGGNVPHPNLQPFLCVTFIIALQGVFPSRS